MASDKDATTIDYDLSTDRIDPTEWWRRDYVKKAQAQAQAKKNGKQHRFPLEYFGGGGL